MTPLALFAERLPHNALRDQALHTFRDVRRDDAALREAREPRDNELLSLDFVRQALD